jgi:hypothetical protein
VRLPLLRTVPGLGTAWKPAGSEIGSALTMLRIAASVVRVRDVGVDHLAEGSSQRPKAGISSVSVSRRVQQLDREPA